MLNIMSITIAKTAHEILIPLIIISLRSLFALRIIALINENMNTKCSLEIVNVMILIFSLTIHSLK
jgi:uncharacterized membrane protein YGL010W